MSVSQYASRLRYNITSILSNGLKMWIPVDDFFLKIFKGITQNLLVINYETLCNSFL